MAENTEIQRKHAPSTILLPYVTAFMTFLTCNSPHFIKHDQEIVFILTVFGFAGRSS